MTPPLSLLAFRAGQAVTSLLDQAELDVTPAEGLVLAWLDDAGPSDVKTLRRVLGLRRSTITSVLDRLHDRKLVVRQVRTDDRRSFLVLLTESGRTAAGRASDVLRELDDRLLSDGVDLDAARQVLEALSDHAS